MGQAARSGITRCSHGHVARAGRLLSTRQHSGFDESVEKVVSDSLQEIRRVVKEFILEEFLPGAAPASLKDDTPLITGSILDSIGIVKLVIFLEQTHGVEFEEHEISTQLLNTVTGIARMVQMKTGKRA